MARLKLSEFRAKSLLVDGYGGHAITFDQVETQLAAIADGHYVLKVDQGVKKRGKQGLVAVNIAPPEALSYVQQWQERGFDRFLLEPLFEHDASEECYLALDRARDGWNWSYSPRGGVDIEDHAEKPRQFHSSQLMELSQVSGISEAFLEHLQTVADAQHMSFVEINPLVVRDGQCFLLDAAVLVDSAGGYFASGWSEADVVEHRSLHPAEQRVQELDENSPAALKLTVINPEASLWLLLSGGGASIAIADTIHAAGFGDQLGNYGEYSGGPTTDETYLYTKEIVELLLASPAPKKALIIAGGVANFTDVAKTFKGIIRALAEAKDRLHTNGVKVFVRRGGPNEVEGLKAMREFLQSADLFGSVYGSDDLLTRAASDAVAFVKGEL